MKNTKNNTIDIQRISFNKEVISNLYMNQNEVERMLKADKQALRNHNHGN